VSESRSKLPEDGFKKILLFVSNFYRRKRQPCIRFFSPQKGSQKISVADTDPGSDAFLTPGSGMGRKSASGSGMNNPDHIL
jgi:hypothetical protein